VATSPRPLQGNVWLVNLGLVSRLQQSIMDGSIDNLLMGNGSEQPILMYAQMAAQQPVSSSFGDCRTCLAVMKEQTP